MKGALCERVNRVLFGHIAEGRFISFFYCLLDAAEGTLTYANAGHYPPVVVRADGTVERLDEGGTVLGVFEDVTYAQGRVTVGAGDRIVFYTDGLTEARNADDEEYGDARLIAAAVQHRACSAPALHARVMDAVVASIGPVTAEAAR